MIQLWAQLETPEDATFADLDAATDDLMEALSVLDGVLDPDVGLSMTERVVLVSLVIDSDDALEAGELGVSALRKALAAAGQGPLSARLLVHESLLGRATKVRTELLPA